MERRSKILFGNQHLLLVAATVAQGSPELSARDLEEVTGLAPSTVHRLLQKFVGADLAVRVERLPGDRGQRYERVPHPFWDAVRAMGDSGGER